VKKILIVEDHNDCREILGLFVTKIGYQPIKACNSDSDSSGHANKYSPDSLKEVILLLDCNFPAIEEADMKEFAEHAQKNNLNAGFKEIWCVNILLDRTIVQQLV